MVPSRRRRLFDPFALDDGVLDEQVVVDLAAVEVAGALDGYALAHAHGVFVAAGQEYARLDAAVRANPQVPLDDVAAEYFDLVVQEEGLPWVGTQLDADANLYPLA